VRDRRLFSGAMIMFSTLFAISCERPLHAASDLPKPAVDLPKAPDGQMQQAVFAGGCFWCTEAVFQQLNGVGSVVSGYAGGSEKTATYEQVCSGTTGHAEAIQITYESSKISYGQLLRVFFATHDPTTKNAQGPDHGTQYRSAIFFKDDEQKRVAGAYIKQLEDAKVFSKPIVTTLEPLERFYLAERYHQDYVDRNPFDPYIQQIAMPKVMKVREKFPDQLKSATQPTTQP
jgi:peptide-methionine (S)-S-oxide reductase